MLPLREAWTSQIHSRQWRIIGPGFFFPLSPLGFTFCVSMYNERERAGASENEREWVQPFPAFSLVPGVDGAEQVPYCAA